MPTTQPAAQSASVAAAPVRSRAATVRLALVIFLPTAVLLTVLAYGLLKTDADLRLQKLKGQEVTEINISQQLMMHDFKYATSDLLFLAHSPSVQRYINATSPIEKQRATENISNMVQTKRRYDQVRYIDSRGKEKIRVNLVNNQAITVPDKALQDKSARYFFRETLRLRPDEIYVSPLDLNIEHGQIELPYKPTIRFGTPLVDRAGKKQGILLLNYLGQELLDDFSRTMLEKHHAMLLDPEGYWLSNPNPALEWGFMFGRDDTFGKYYPAAWASIAASEQGSLQTAEGLYTFATVRPIFAAQAALHPGDQADTAQNYHLKLVSFIPAGELPAVVLSQYPRSFVLFLIGLLLLAALALYLAATLFYRRLLRATVFENEAHLKEITSTMGEGVFVVDNHERTTFINPEAERLLGWSQAELINQNAHKLFHYRKLDGTLIPAGNCEIYQVMQTGNAYRSNTQVFWRKDGTPLHVDVNATPIVRDGKIVGAVVAFSDIGKQKQAEAALLNSEAQLKQAQRLAQMGSWELEHSTQKLTWSEEIYRIFEAEPGTFDPSYEAFLSFIHPQDRERVNQSYLASVKNHAPYHTEHRLLFADGRIKHVIERGETFYDADNHPIRSIGTVQDITEHKQLEEERLRAEALFHMVFNNVADAIIIHDFSGHFLEVNQVFCERMGYSRDELLKMSPLDIYAPEDAAEFSSHAQKLKDNSKLTCEMTHISRDGRNIPVEISARLIEYQGKAATLSVVRDISERRATQEALRSSAETARALLNANKESAILMDVNGIILSINNVGARRLRKKPEEIIGKNVFDLLPPEIAARRKAVVGEVARSGLPCQYQDVRNGMTLDQNLYPIFDAQGRVSQIAVYAADISERLKLQSEETLLHHIDQQVLRSNSLSDLLQFVCDEIVQLFGYHFALLGRKEADGEFSISAHSGSASAYLHDLERIGLRWDDTPQGKGPAGACVRSGQMQVFKITDSSFQPWHEAAVRFGFQSIVGIPLIVRGEVYGALLLYSQLEQDFDDAITLQRLSGIASRICVALEMAMDQEQLRLLGSALASAGNAIFITDPAGRIQWVNNAFTRLTGYTEMEAIGRTPSFLKSGKQDSTYYQKLWRTIQQGKTWSNETVERHKTGMLFTAQQTITPILNDAAQITHYISILDDISAQKEIAARIQHMAHFDALTALPNRSLFRDRLRQTLVQAKRDDQTCALMFIDLDRFKEVNDTLGHHIGDLLLQAVAQRLKSCVREADTVSRLAGDEFTVLLPHVQGRDDAALIAEKITASLAAPFHLDGHEVQIGSSTGIAFYPADATSDEALLKCSDHAMYAAKEQGRGTFRFYQAPL